jgi:general secretion pathway protein A
VATPAAVTRPHERFYGLSGNPFGRSAEPASLYHSGAHDRAVADLIEAIRRGVPVVTLTGEAGIGRTSVCRSLVDQLGRRTVASFIGEGVTSLEDLLRRVLVDFGVLSRGDVTGGKVEETPSSDLFGALDGFARSLSTLEATAVVVIDDADRVPADIVARLSPVVEERANGRPVQIVLVGQPDFLAALRRPPLDAIGRHVGAGCRMAPLTAAETAGYVTHRLAIAAPNGRLEFDQAAFARLHAETGGVPRLVNVVCDRVLELGYEAEAGTIGETLIATAATDLQLSARAGPRRRRALILAVACALGAAAAWFVLS